MASLHVIQPQAAAVQNALARTVMGTKRHVHITPVLAELHWLPVSARIQFKIALLTVKTLTTHQPSYLLDLLQLRHPSRFVLPSAALHTVRHISGTLYLMTSPAILTLPHELFKVN